MTIFVTQGHEKGIGLEVFLKSFLQHPIEIQEKIKLICSQNSLLKNLENLRLPYSLSDNLLTIISSKLQCQFIETSEKSQSLLSLETALGQIKENDILFTLPTSKDQLIVNNQNYLGYTEYLRSNFNNLYLPMVFVNPKISILLLSDHIPLKDVTSFLSEELILAKIKTFINSMVFKKLCITRFIFSGINPHAGENGLLGNEDIIISRAIEKLTKIYPHLEFIGPRAGDSMMNNLNRNPNEIFVFSFHDQGLSAFKAKFGTLGANCTFGLPFMRLSVDHGTAFEISGKNIADSSGCYYCLDLAHTWSS